MRELQMAICPSARGWDSGEKKFEIAPMRTTGWCCWQLVAHGRTKSSGQPRAEHIDRQATRQWPSSSVIANRETGTDDRGMQVMTSLRALNDSI